MKKRWRWRKKQTQKIKYLMRTDISVLLFPTAFLYLLFYVGLSFYHCMDLVSLYRGLEIPRLYVNKDKKIRLIE